MRVLGALAALAAALQIGLLSFVLASRIAYPMDIEWLEGATIYQAQRLTLGQPIYGPLTQGFLPHPYPPLYIAALAAVGAVFGLDYPSGRGLSIALLLGAAAILARAAAAHSSTSGSRDRLFGVLALGSIAATFPHTDGWFDLVRNDTAAVAIPVFAAGASLATRLTPLRVVGIALLLSAAVFIKQTGIVFLPVVALYVLARDRRLGWLLLAVTGLSSLAGLAVLEAATGGWFVYWTFLLGDQPIVWRRAFDAGAAFLAMAPYLLLLFWAVPRLVRRKAMSPHLQLWLGMLAAALVSAVLPYLKPYGHANNFLPVALLAGPVCLMVCGELLRTLRDDDVPRARNAVLASATLVLLLSLWNPSAHVPSGDQWERADALNRFVAELPGDVFVPNHPHLAIRNGSRTEQIHTMPYLDVELASASGAGLDALLLASDARWAILDGREGTVAARVRRHFGSERPLPIAVETLAGFRTGPKWLLERKRGVLPGSRRVLFDFESTTFEGWDQEGLAFEAGPGPAERATPGGVSGASGRRVASSFHPKLGNPARGIIVSPRFAIDRSHLGFLVAGGARGSTRVDLLVDGEVRRSATGASDGVLYEVVWNLEELDGREARVALVDVDPGRYGHIIADRFELFDLLPAEPRSDP